jgi:hypothetical protein
MPDLVGTCPAGFWEEWFAEGDAAGDPETGEEWGWYTRDRLARTMQPGDRFYVVARGLLRGWAPVVRLADHGDSFVICREGGAVACTIDDPIPGFRGLRRRWWQRELERPFPDWKTAMPAPAASKAAYVLSQAQTRDHACHWPGCSRQVPPAMWGCKPHWNALPKDLRDEIWRAYRPGQEKTLTPSRAYVEAARKVQNWILANAAGQQQLQF